MTRPLAVFDFDGTLTYTDTLLAFLATVSPTRTLRHAPAAALTASCCPERRDQAKEQLIADVLDGLTDDDAEAAGRRFIERHLHRLLRPSGLARLRHHQARHDTTVVASASPQVTVVPAARALGIDHVICTQVRRCDGRWRIVGPNLRGEHKLREVERLARALRPSTTWAYGNGRDDVPLLSWADTGVRIGSTSVTRVLHVASSRGSRDRTG